MKSEIIFTPYYKPNGHGSLTVVRINSVGRRTTNSIFFPKYMDEDIRKFSIALKIIISESNNIIEKQEEEELKQ